MSSAASLISCACHRRYMQSNAVILIHQIRGEVSGKCQDVKDGWNNYEMAQNRLIGIYEQYTKMNRREIIKSLRDEKEWDAEKCLKSGLIDEIL